MKNLLSMVSLAVLALTLSLEYGHAMKRADEDYEGKITTKEQARIEEDLIQNPTHLEINAKSNITDEELKRKTNAAFVKDCRSKAACAFYSKQYLNTANFLKELAQASPEDLTPQDVVNYHQSMIYFYEDINQAATTRLPSIQKANMLPLELVETTPNVQGSSDNSIEMHFQQFLTQVKLKIESHEKALSQVLQVNAHPVQEVDLSMNVAGSSDKK